MMTTNTKINIALTGLIVSVLFFGGYFLIKNVSVETRVSQEQRSENGVVAERADVAALKQELISQIEKRQERFDTLNNQIVSAQNACENVVLANVTPQTIRNINKENFTQTVASYYTCDAIANKDVERCSFLRGVDTVLFERCRMSAINIRIAVEKCSVESMSQCARSGLFSQTDCNNVCAVFSKGDTSACGAIKDPNLNKGCLALTQKKVEICEGIADASQKASCVNEYYFYSAIKDANVDLLNKMEESFKQSIGKVIFGVSPSCGNEFGKFINAVDCAMGSLGNYDAIQNEMGTLRNEIAELNKKLNALQ